MTREQLNRTVRKQAAELLANVPDNQVRIAVEKAMNQEWWRGYYAGVGLAQRPRGFAEKHGTLIA